MTAGATESQFTTTVTNPTSVSILLTRARSSLSLSRREGVEKFAAVPGTIFHTLCCWVSMEASSSLAERVARRRRFHQPERTG
jgi:hypothetical protein